MADTGMWAPQTLLAALTGSTVNLESDVKAVLVGEAWTFDPDAHAFASSITAELVGGGYAREALTGLDLSFDAEADALSWTFTPFTLEALTGEFRHVAYILDTGSDATSRIVKVDTYDATKTATAADVTISPDVGGAARVVLSS